MIELLDIEWYTIIDLLDIEWYIIRVNKHGVVHRYRYSIINQ